MDIPGHPGTVHGITGHECHLNVVAEAVLGSVTLIVALAAVIAMAGDVERNPGPITSCAICGSEITVARYRYYLFDESRGRHTDLYKQLQDVLGTGASGLRSSYACFDVC